MEMVSLDALKCSRSMAGKNFPNFELLDFRIASQFGGTESPNRG